MLSFPFNNRQPIPFRIVDFGRAADSILDEDVDNFEYKIPNDKVDLLKKGWEEVVLIGKEKPDKYYKIDMLSSNVQNG
jgi:hypothetical protein